MKNPDVERAAAFIRLLHTFQNRNDPESVFVYAKEMRVMHDELYANKREKIGEQKEARELLEQIITAIGDDWNKYFIA